MEKNKMLIDATHPEETRVVVLRQGRVEEFDFESASRKPLRGNIYLAKVTRVEPSLQAAFVEYGGNRHGFLAFSEIHPDYYQIPVADREALKREEAAAESEDEDETEPRGRGRPTRRRRRTRRPEQQAQVRDDRDSDDGAADRDGGPVDRELALSGDHGDDVRRAEVRDDDIEPVSARDDRYPADDLDGGDAAGADAIESIDAAEDALEEVPERPRRRMRQYKIQEVIKRRQIMLIQVVKEERGNKGAALTTYISLAGRYTVLMPNTGRGGGISRKITQAQDRRRLKAIAEELEVSDGMGLIIRTAGASRTMQEIRRDYEYLLRLWESVRDMTLSSTAPCLVYEEGNLIKRSIRDLYSKDIDSIVVAGDAAHREAQDFMSMLMPGHADNVRNYRDPEPLFTRFGIERQLNAMFSPHVTLRSGGYIVLNQTEALVAIDVNSGKATREFSIEETAYNTNLEAAEEIARQLKLRDLAGLIVIDFIDMEEKRNNRSVERRLKDALQHDRARIQVGRISHFGLLEMSRQRLRTGVVEGSTSQCPHCQGTGIIRSIESVSLAVLRGLEDQLLKQPSGLIAYTTDEVALYTLNHKRNYIEDMERRYGIRIVIEANERMQGANFSIERTAAAVAAKPVQRAAVSMDWGFNGNEEDVDRIEEDDSDGLREEGRAEPRQRSPRPDADADEEARPGRRRRRRGRGGRDRSDGESRPAARHDDNGHYRARDPDEDGERDRPTADERPVARDRGAPGHARRPYRDEPRYERGVGEAVREQRSERDERYDDDRVEPRYDDPRSSDRDEVATGEQKSGGRRGRRRGRRGGKGRGPDTAVGSEARDERRGDDRTERPRIVSTDNGDWGAPTVRDEPDRERPTIVETVEPRRADVLEARSDRYGIVETARDVETARQVEPESAVDRHPPQPTAASSAPLDQEPAMPQKRGWWQRRFGGG